MEAIPSPVGTDRYGQRRAGRRWPAVTAAVTLLVAAVAWAAWVAWSNPAHRLTWQDEGYQVRDDGRTDVTFSVDMADGMRAVCRVRALNVRFAEVGSLEVEVGPSTGSLVRRTVVVPTSERAVTGTVHQCRPR